MNSHLIEFSTLLVLFTLAYHFLLKENKNYSFLRLYCLAAVLISILFPLLPAFQPTQVIVVNTMLPTLTITPKGGQELIPVVSSLMHSYNLFAILYAIVAIGFGVRFIISMIRLFQIISQSEKTKLFGLDILYSKHINEPCSIFNYIILPKSKQYDAETIQTILEHERLHISYGHTAEKLFLELARIFFWFHPAIWYLKREIHLIHEYQVDAAMNQRINEKNYKSILIQLATQQNNLQLVNPFASQIKKRLTMMNSISTFKKRSYLFLALVLIGGSFILHSCQKEANNKVIEKENFQSNFDKSTATESEIKAYEEWTKGIDKSKSEKYYALETNISVDTVIVFNPKTFEETVQVVRGLGERPPLFPGCSDDLGFQEHVDCSNQKMLTYIYSNVTYPEQARTQEKEGLVLVKLFINKSGQLDTYKILRSPDDSLTSAVEDVIKKLQREITWIPGLKDGDKDVNAEFVLPVKFKLE